MKTLTVQTFAPSSAYTRPEPLPYKLTTSNHTIGALFSAPATKAIILKHLPKASFLPGVSGKAFFTTMSIRDLALAIPEMLPKPGLDLVDEEFATLPKSEWPSDDQ